MQVIVGLGNPGSDYQKTRHNAGFMLVNFLAAELAEGRPFRTNHSHKAQVIKLTQPKLLLIKPLTYMNNSGQAVRAVLDYFADTDQLLARQNLYVAHDDLDLGLGQFKIQLGKGPKQHGGLLSIYQHLGTDRFWHIRLGIDDRQGERLIPPEKYVLQQLGVEKLDILNKTLVEVKRELLTVGVKLESE